jgi:hypothetical protein
MKREANPAKIPPNKSYKLNWRYYLWENLYLMIPINAAAITRGTAIETISRKFMVHLV